MPGFSVDSHPQKKKIIAAILAGRTVREIGRSVVPPVPFNVIQRYKASVIRPILANAEESEQLRNETNQPVPLTSSDTAVQAVQRAVQAGPILSIFRQRLEKLNARTDRALDQAEAGRELNVMAPLLNVGLKATEMLGRATGELEQQATGFSIQIVCPSAPTPDAVRVSFAAPDAIDAPVEPEPAEFEEIGLLQRPT